MVYDRNILKNLPYFLIYAGDQTEYDEKGRVLFLFSHIVFSHQTKAESTFDLHRVNHGFFTISSYL